MRIRYRILTRVEGAERTDPPPDLDLADIIRIGRANTTFFGNRRSRSSGASGPPPCNVLESDAEAEVEEVRQLILEGRMLPTDLIGVESGWVEARAFGPLVEACMEVEEQGQRKGRWFAVLAVVGGLVGLLLFAYLTWTLR